MNTQAKINIYSDSAKCFAKYFRTLMGQIGLITLIFLKKRIGIMRRLALALSQSIATERINSLMRIKTLYLFQFVDQILSNYSNLFLKKFLSATLRE